MSLFGSIISLAYRLMGRTGLGDPNKGDGKDSPLQVGMAGQTGGEWNPFSNYGNPIELFYDFYETNPWVKGVCNKIATEVRNDGWAIEDLTKKKRGHPNRDELEEWLTNSHYEQIRFWAALDLAICHNAYFYIQRNGLKQIVGFLRIPPQTMRPVGNSDDGLICWKQRVGHREKVFKLEDIWHIKGPNPLSDVIGLPLMTACLVDVEADNAMSQFNQKYFGNGTSAGMILTWDQSDIRNPKNGEWSSGDEAKAEKIWISMVNHVEKRYANPKNAHLPLILRGKWDVHGQGQAQADAQFLNGRMFNARMVCTVYGFPMEALGLGEKGKLGGTLVDGSQEQLDSVVDGFAKLIDKSFEQRILHEELDWTGLSVRSKLRPTKLTEGMTLAVKHLSMTNSFRRNELRAIVKMPPLPGPEGEELVCIPLPPPDPVDEQTKPEDKPPEDKPNDGK